MERISLYVKGTTQDLANRPAKDTECVTQMPVEDAQTAVMSEREGHGPERKFSKLWKILRAYKNVQSLSGNSGTNLD